MKVKTPTKFGRVSKTIKTKRTKYEPKQMEIALEAEGVRFDECHRGFTSF